MLALYRAGVRRRAERRQRALAATPAFPALIGELVEALEPRAIAVLCSGPSARRFRPQEGTLCVATNESWRLCRGLPFLYCLSDTFMVRRYVTLGMPVGPEATLFWAHPIDADRPEHVAAAEFAAYHRRLRRRWPEAMAFPEPLVRGAAENDAALASWISTRLGMGPRLMNSGLVALQLGYCVASWAGGLPLHLFGLDLGDGAMEYFDGRRLHRSQGSIVSARVRNRAARLVTALSERGDLDFHDHTCFDVRSALIAEPEP